jgi:hypothetical protein
VFAFLSQHHLVVLAALPVTSGMLPASTLPFERPERNRLDTFPATLAKNNGGLEMRMPSLDERGM